MEIVAGTSLTAISPGCFKRQGVSGHKILQIQLQTESIQKSPFRLVLIVLCFSFYVDIILFKSYFGHKCTIIKLKLPFPNMKIYVTLCETE